MEQKNRTSKTSATKNSQSKKVTSRKKTSVSSNTALVLSVGVLFLCVVMLFISFIFTQKTSDKKEMISSSKIIEQEKNSLVEQPSVSEKTSSKKTETATTKKTLESSSSKTVKSKNTEVSQSQVKSTSNNKTQVKPVQANSTGTTSLSVGEKQSSVLSNEISVPTKKVADVYIVLDDGGHNLNQLYPFLELDFPLTIAVLPKLAYSKEAANLTVKSGKTLILHQPMQAVNLQVDPGPGSIQPNMTAQQIREVLTQNLDSVGVKIGLNNHEGSLITADTYAMKVVMEVCKERGLFFLDSRTNSKSICKNVASEYGINFYERNIFLDNTPNQTDMISMFESGIEIAKKNGSVIMIGHVWSGKNLADVLQKMYDKYNPQGFIFGELK